MALPAQVTFATITGKLVRELVTGDTPSQGQVTFTPDIPNGDVAVSSSTPPVMVAVQPMPVSLAADGSFTVPLVASGNAALNPTGWTYTVSFSLTNETRASFHIGPLTSGTTYDLAALVPVVISTGVLDAAAFTLALAGKLDTTTASSTYVALAGSQTIGNGSDSVPGTTKYGLQLSEAFVNPNAPIMQHFVGYSFFSGTQGVSAGTLQGGSCESSAFNNGTADMGTVLGFEAIGAGSGDNARKVGTIIGGQGTAFINGTQTSDLLISLRASGPRRDSGTGAVAEARSLDVQEPAVGTIRRAIYSVGTARFRKGTAANALEISNAANTLQWSSDGSTLTGYASDGASGRLILDPQDTAAQHILSNLFGTGNHLTLQNNGGSVFAITYAGEVYLSSSGALRSIQFGAADSGGVGYKMMRVLN